jgi:protein-disulfide isomerase
VKKWKIGAALTVAAAVLAPLAFGNGPEAGAQSVQSPTRESFIEDPVAPRYQPAAYDLTIVMFSDYQCPYCRKVHPVLEQALAEDKKIRVIYRDWPIFGAASTTAARLAIASKWQNKHSAFHDQLMRMPGKLSDHSIRHAADLAGVNWDRLQADLKTHGTEIDALITRNSRQAASLGLQGTPGFIIGSYLIPGGLDLGTLREVIREARANPNGPPKQADGSAAERPAL